VYLKIQAQYYKGQMSYRILNISPGPASGFGPATESEHLHLLELCAGSHRISDAASEYGLNALPMDVSCIRISKETEPSR
jgi:hypothetical protein